MLPIITNLTGITIVLTAKFLTSFDSAHSLGLCKLQPARLGTNHTGKHGHKFELTSLFERTKNDCVSGRGFPFLRPRRRPLQTEATKWMCFRRCETQIIFTEDITDENNRTNGNFLWFHLGSSGLCCWWAFGKFYLRMFANKKYSEVA